MQQPTWVEFTGGLFPVLVVVFVFRSFLFEPFKIPSPSMVPTLLVGDFILVNKYAYGIRLPVLNRKIIEVGQPQRGDVMVFRYPEDQKLDYIKRVVGVPGDRVEYKNKRLSINGKELGYQEQPDYIDGESLVTSRQYVETAGQREYKVLNMDSRPSFVLSPRDFAGRDQCNYGAEGFSCTVPAGQYFMMGDNRDNSEDSRFWGFVPDENIVGKAVSVWMNFGNLSHIGLIR